MISESTSWSPSVYLRNTGVRGPPKLGVAGSTGKGGTESDSNTVSWTGMGFISTKSACNTWTNKGQKLQPRVLLEIISTRDKTDPYGEGIWPDT